MTSASHLWRKVWPGRNLSDLDLRALTYAERGVWEHLQDLMWCNRDAPRIRNDDIYIAGLLNGFKLALWQKTKAKLLVLGLITESADSMFLESKRIENGFKTVCGLVEKLRDAGIARQSKLLKTHDESGAYEEPSNLLGTRPGAATPRSLEAKKKEPPIVPQKTGDNNYFLEFYRNYPRKVGKPAAQRAWRKLNPDSELIAFINSALEKWKLCEQWKNLEFVPHPATWLNQRRWEDDPAPAARAKVDLIGANLNNNGRHTSNPCYCVTCELAQMSSVCIRCGAELLTNSQALFEDV